MAEAPCRERGNGQKASGQLSVGLKIARLLYQPYKWLVFIPLLCFYTIVLGGLAIILASLFNARLAMKLAGNPWARLNCLTVPVLVTVRNRHNIIPGQSYVVVSNHQSLVDILVIAGWLGIDIRWVAKASLRNVPVFGPASAKMEHIFIDRSNARAARETISNARKNITNGTSVMFFAEGTRSTDGSLKAFKSGAFRMALDLGVPVLPVTVRGTRKILPPGSMKLFPGRAEIVVHPQIETGFFSQETMGDLVEKTRSAIGSALP